MSFEESKRVALEWIKLVNDGNYDALRTFAAPSTNWWLSGLTSKASMAGDATYASRIDTLESFRTAFKSFELVTRDVVVEGNTVILENEVTAMSHDGRVYRNNAMVKLRIEEGKIKDIREYVDLLAVFEFMGASV
ncbi:hypothetical protein CVT24_003135 [Panaeolus cyanescens]|uniref:SnoaL-like domain-containing protein n=1 Tax=Panaeolus cyanescens TaxID=181874 RepID=A0A409WTA5_9AGAR|nr:hypothetical protein CVT24_003135 [Panaeolus cyanescens]